MSKTATLSADQTAAYDELDAGKDKPYYVGPSGERHQILVENQSAEYKSPLGKYLRKPSYLDPSKLMYRKVSDDPIDTDGEDATILDCAQEDHVEALRLNDVEAMRIYTPMVDPQFQVQSMTRDAPVSIPVQATSSHVL